ncbi:MAG: flagellar protein [Clostridia bacterium]|nr:flagellar protein [Clostridia bacterium]
MDSMIYNKMLHTPIYTGTPGEPQRSRPQEKSNDNAFKELLEQRLKEESQVSFSKHAMERVVERGVDVSSEKLDRLNEGVRMAEEKGLREPLILLGTTAFVVNVKNNKVVTVVNEDSLKGTVFTNIDGTVMI